MHFVEHTMNLLQQGARNLVPKSVEINDESRITDNELVAISRGQHSITSFGVRIEGRNKSDHNGAGGSSSSSSACSSSSLRQLKDCASTSKASVQGHMKQPSTDTPTVGGHACVGTCLSCHNPNVSSWSRCTFCDRRSCAACQRTCIRCQNQFCSLCSVLNYDACNEEAAFCLQCMPQ